MEELERSIYALKMEINKLTNDMKNLDKEKIFDLSEELDKTIDEYLKC